MTNALACSFDSLKKMSKEFFDALPSLTIEELDNAFKCLSLGYLNLDASENEQHQAQYLLQIAGRHFIAREAELTAA